MGTPLLGSFGSQSPSCTPNQLNQYFRERGPSISSHASFPDDSTLRPRLRTTHSPPSQDGQPQLDSPFLITCPPPDFNVKLWPHPQPHRVPLWSIRKESSKPPAGLCVATLFFQAKLGHGDLAEIPLYSSKAGSPGKLEHSSGVLILVLTHAHTHISAT